MAFAGELGLTLDLNKLNPTSSMSEIVLLFSETPSRFLVEVPPVARKGFETMMKGYVTPLGTVTKDKTLVVKEAKRKTT